MTATRPGTWTWESFGNVDDEGLRGRSGSYEAVPWSEAQKKANLCRAGMYGSVLSGGLAGYVHELQAMYDGARSPKAVYKMWDAFKLKTADQAVYLKNFVMSLGGRHAELIPDEECLVPSKSGSEMGWTGWAYCAYTPDREIFLAYFEKQTPREGVLLRNGVYGGTYRLTWYNPRTGRWLDRNETTTVGVRGWATLPRLPDDEDWALKLELV